MTEANAEFKHSGNNLTVKRPAPTSPANIRKVDPMKGLQNGRHTHIPVPKSFWSNWFKKG